MIESVAPRRASIATRRWYLAVVMGIIVGMVPIGIGTGTALAATAPSIVSSTLVDGSYGNVTSIDVSNNGAAENDLMIVQIARDSSDNAVPPAEWNLLRRDALPNSYQAIYWKIAGPSEPATSSWSFTDVDSDTVIWSVRISGADTLTPIGASDVMTDNFINLHSPSVAATTTDSLLFTMYLSDWGNGGYSPHAGMTEQADRMLGFVSLYAASETLTSTTPTGVRTATADNPVSHDNLGVSLVVNPTASPPNVVTVNSTGDASDLVAGDGVCDTGGTIGPDPECTLRAAIEEANGGATVDTVEFNIPAALTGGEHVIAPGGFSGLPPISLPITIDATTDLDFTGTPVVALSGENATFAAGLTLEDAADGSTIRGLNIRDWSFDGIRVLTGNDASFIEGNWIGNLDASGAGTANPNSFAGIRIQGTNTTVGGPDPEDRNVVSGNGQSGIVINGETADGNTIRNNIIGVLPDESGVLGNTNSGVLVSLGPDDTDIIDNLIAHPGINGIEINDASTGTVIQGNIIGTNRAGSADWSGGDAAINLYNGVADSLIGGTTGAQGNVIANAGSNPASPNGILLQADAGSGNTIIGNSIYGSRGIGIDLEPAGVTSNDPGDTDLGPNDLLNFPAITSAEEVAGTVTVTFDLDVPANPDQYRVEFFKNPSGTNPGGNYEGEAFASAVTTGPGTGLTHTFSGSVGDVITASATRIDSGAVTGFSSTSEFSAAHTVTSGTCADSDIDGLCDLEEDANTDADNDPATNPGPNTDGDANPNYLDADDDGDGTPTASENADPNGDGDPRDAVDSDRDGQPDWLDAPITGVTSGAVGSEQKISDLAGGLAAALDDGDVFGSAVSGIGDLDGDGVNDLVVGARYDNDGGTPPDAHRGAVYVLFMNANGTVKSEQKISDTVGGLTTALSDGDQFGVSVAGIGDIDGDGINDILVGADADDGGGFPPDANRGAVYVLLLNANGTVKSEQKIGDGLGGLAATLVDGDLFGVGVAGIGDLDDDGINDIAVGAYDDDGGTSRGAVYVLFLNANGTVKAEQKISSTVGGLSGLGDSDLFGRSVAGIGDLDGDGVEDIAVNAILDDDGGTNRGAIYVLFLNPNGTVKSQQKISDTDGGLTTPLEDSDYFGVGVAGLGDIDGDGINDIAAGAAYDDDGGVPPDANRGAVFVLFLNANGTVKGEQKISDTIGGLSATLGDDDSFGVGVASLGDIDNDGSIDIAVGSLFDDDGGTDRGAVYVLNLGGLYSISGTVFEDIAGDVLDDGTIGDGNNPGAVGVTVRLYDGGSTLVGTDTTDASGTYSFSGLANDTYQVVVDSRTVPSSQDPGAALGDIWAEQTYGPIDGLCANGTGSSTANTAAGPCYGGFSGAVSDDAGTIKKHQAVFDVAGGDVTNVDFGFSFNVVVNTRGGDNTDDDTGANRTVQGSLRQFIQNANAISGANAMRFVPVEPTDGTDGSGRDWWSVAVTAALPTVSGPSTTIDGTAYNLTNGVTLRDTNSLGPELELNGTGTGGTVDGLLLTGGTSAVRDLVINRFGRDGIRITTAGGNTIVGTYLGTSATGTADLGNVNNGVFIISTPGNTIGGLSAGDRNVISGNNNNGLLIDGVASTGNVIQGNYVGLNATGTGPIGNTDDGVDISDAPGNTIGGTDPAARNVIGGQGDVGLLFVGAQSTGNVAVNNYIGTNAAGSAGVPNATGVAFLTGASSNRLGGTSANEFNLIAHNTGDAVRVTETAGADNAILRNSIFGNGGLGIDSAVDGVTPNGAGDPLDYPVVTSAIESGGTVTVDFTLDVPNGDYRLEFFDNTAADPSGNGEGEAWVGSVDVTVTGGVPSPASTSFSGVAGDIITATATEGTAVPFGETSEFSASFTVTAAPSGNSPTAVAGGPYSTVEGDDLILDGSGSSDPDTDPLTYNWDIDNDGQYDDATGVNPTVAWATLVGLGLNDDGGPYPIGLEVDDGNGNTDTATVNWTITNAAPTITTTGSGSATSGSPYTLNLGVTDPGNDTVSEWRINWGDGTIDTLVGNPSSATHTYANPGEYNVSVSVLDEDSQPNLPWHQDMLIVPGLFANEQVFRLEATTGTVIDNIATGTGLGWSLTATIGPDGMLWVGDYTGDNIRRYNPYTGADLGVIITNTPGGLNGPAGMQFGPNGNLFVSSNFGDTILEYQPDGTYVGIFASGNGLNEPDDLIWGPDGRLYVTSFHTDQVLVWNSDGTPAGVFAASVEIDQPSELTFDSDGKLYVTSVARDQVVRFNADGSYDTIFATAGATGLNEPRAAFFGPDGHLYVGGRNRIVRYNGSSGALIDVYLASGTISGPSQGIFLPGHQVTVARAPSTVAVVNSTGDASDTTPGDGFCDTGNRVGVDPECTLRAAIEEARTSATVDSIHFAIPDTDPGFQNLGAGASYWRIEPGTSYLPISDDGVVIDATTQTTFAIGRSYFVNDLGPEIELVGTTAGGVGLQVTANNVEIRGLVINRFVTGIGVHGGDGSIIAGNYIGPDPTGAIGQVGNTTEGIEVDGATNTVIGGSNASDRNVISGNRLRGVALDVDTPTTAGTQIIGNYIGTNATGDAALLYDATNSQQIGIYILNNPGTVVGTATDGNVISGNSWFGIYGWGASATGTVIQGNIVGLDAVAANPVPNGTDPNQRAGIYLSSISGALIGGVNNGEGNIIAGNDDEGLILFGATATGNALLGNQIYSNTGIGIDLAGDGVTLNDPGDTGPNDMLNYPVITLAEEATGTVTLEFDFDGPAGDYRIEFFTNTAADGSGYGEGESLVHFFDISSHPGGAASYSTSFSGTAGDIITATSTEDLGASFGSTSEFSATFTVTIANDPPVAVDDAYSVDEDQSLSVAASGVLGNDSDPEGDPITAVLVAGPSNAQSFTLNSDGSFDYTPTANWSGSDSFTYQADDSLETSNTATVTITVGPVNDPPDVTDPGDQSDAEGDVISLFVAASDPEGDGLTWGATGLPAGLTMNSGTGEISGTISYSASTGSPYSVTVTVTDDGTPNEQGQVAFSWTVANTNQAPLAVDDAYMVDEDQTLSIAAPGVLGNDSDPDGDPRTAVLVAGPSNAVSFTLNADGSFDYTPTANWSGNDSFTYRATDGSDPSNTATVTITVNPVNDPPVAIDDSYSTDEDTALNVAASGVLGNDTDEEGDSLSAVLVGAPSNAASFTLNADGSFDYTPAANWNGTDTFAYQADDGDPSNTATVTITVNAVNDPPVAVDDADTTPEDTTVTVDLFGNDSDPEGDAFWIQGLAQPSNGSVSDNGNGTVDYTPDPGWSGVDTFQYSLTDGTDPSNVATVTVTVNPVNDPPDVTDPGDQSDAEGDVISLLVAASDPEGDGMTWGATGLPAGLTMNSGTGEISGTVDYSASGGSPYSVTVTVTDDGTPNEQGQVTFAWTVTNTNRPPVAVDDSDSTSEDTAVTVDLFGNDSDPDGDAFTIQGLSQGSDGSVSDNGNGTVDYTPDPGWSGTDTFTYSLTDGSDPSNVATVTITVNPVNDPPVAVDDFYSVDEDQTLTVPAAGVLGNDSDPEGDPFTAVLVAGPSNAQSFTLNADGSFDYTPSANWNGSDSFTYRATDGDPSNTATVTITVNPINDPPVATGDAYATSEDTPLSVASPGVLSNDVDVESDPMTAVLVAGPSNAQSFTLNADGSFDYTPALNYTGIDSFTYTANDTEASNTVTVSITVGATNDPPVAVDDAYAVDEDQTLSVAVAGVLGNDTDVEGDPLTAVLVAGPSNAQSFTLNPNGSFDYTPTADWSGADSFDYTANDAGPSNVATVTITVNAVNDAPVAVDDAYAVDEDQTLNVAASGVLTNDSDVEGDPPTAVLVAGPSNAASFTLNGDGSFDYTPAANWSGSDTFTYRADDADPSNVATVTITVNPVNDAPVAGDDSYNVDEDQTLTVAASGVLSNDSDPEGDPFTATLVTGPTNAASFTLNADGSFDYTPVTDFNGSDSFAYTADDTDPSNVATVTITVNPINDPPVAVDDSAVTDEDTAVVIDLFANDSDADGDGFSMVSVSNGANGSVVDNGNGTVTYTPNADFTGSDSFVYSITDGTDNSNVATVTVTVNPVNDAPVAVDDGYAVDEDTLLSVAAAGVLGNDTDTEGDPLTAVLVSGPSNALSFTLNANGSFDYTPTADWSGADSFTYTANDASPSNVATVTITVNPVNDPPVAVDDSATTDEDGPVTVDVVANDSDADGDSFSIQGLAQGSNGSVVDHGDGTVTYSPDPGWSGVDTFQYSLTDGTDPSNVATVTVTVNLLNDPPVAVDDGYAVDEDTLLSVEAAGVLGNDTDVDGDPLTAVLVTGPTNAASFALNGDGSFDFTPAADFFGTDSFTYTANDAGPSNVATVTITVNPVNDVPVATDDAASTNEDVPVTIDVLANDTDGEGDPLSIQGLAQGSNGTVVDHGHGTVTYMPDPGWSGVDTFQYSLTDGTDPSNVATVTVTVSAVNDPPVASDDSFGVDEDATLTVTAPGVLAGDSDPEGDSLSASVVGGPSNSSQFSLAGDGGFVYQPVADFFGTDQFTYSVSDGNGGSATATVTITVDPVNDPPVVESLTVSVPETVETGSVVGTVAGSDPDDEPIAYSIEGDARLVIGGASGAVSIRGEYAGGDVITATVTAQDSGGLTGSAQVLVTITAVNRPPVIAASDMVVASDVEVGSAVGAVSASDPDGDPVNLVLVGDGRFGIDSAGTVTTLSAISDLAGRQLQMTVVATDDEGLSSTASFSIVVESSATLPPTTAAANTPPTAVDDVVHTSEDTPMVFSPLANDSDIDGDALRLVRISPPKFGDLSEEPGGTWLYSPEPDWSGQELIEYAVSDGTTETVARILFLVDAVNDAPKLVNQSEVNPVAVGGQLEIPLPGIVDAEGDAFVVTIDQPDHGTAELNDGVITYVPDDGYRGDDSIRIYVTDSMGATGTGVILLEVVVDGETISVQVFDLGPMGSGESSTGDSGPGGGADGPDDGGRPRYALFGSPLLGILAAEALTATWAVRIPLGAFLVVAFVSFVSVARHPFRLRIRPFELPVDATYRWSVVLVPEGEGVPVRGGPDHPHEIISRIPAGTNIIEGTGRRNRMNGTLWVEVKTADGVGWADGLTLTPLVDPGLVAGDPRLHTLLAHISDAIVSGGSIEHFVSGRGLHYLHDGEIRRIPVAYVDEALADMWNPESTSAALRGSPQSAARALTSVMRTDLAAFEPPIEFANFSQVVVGDDDPWFLFFEYGPEGSPLLVAMSPAEPTSHRR